MTTFVCTTEGRLCTEEVAARFEHRADYECPAGIAALVGAVVRGLGAKEVATFREQRAEVECTGGVAALITATVGGLGADEITALLEEYTEVRCGRRVALVVGAAERGLGSLHIALLGKRSTELEGIDAGGDRSGNGFTRFTRSVRGGCVGGPGGGRWRVVGCWLIGPWGGSNILDPSTI
jgi:hypothetical protein